jgi:hypothetical protein
MLLGLFADEESHLCVEPRVSMPATAGCWIALFWAGIGCGTGRRLDHLSLALGPKLVATARLDSAGEKLLPAGIVCLHYR